jgi:salicylate hydroxylase
MAQSEPLRIIIVGAGIGGLSTAIALRQAGHRVEVLEQSAFKSEAGTALTLYSNASRVLCSFGLNLFEIGAVPNRAYCRYQAGATSGLRQTILFKLGVSAETLGAPHVFSHRADLHQALKDKAVSTEESGHPVQIHLNSTVVSYDPVEGSVTLRDGTMLSADLVVAADGLHSKAHTYILGYEFPLRASKTTVMRFTVPSDFIRGNPATAPLLAGGNDTLRFYTVPGERDRFLLQSPCRK